MIVNIIINTIINNIINIIINNNNNIIIIIIFIFIISLSKYTDVKLKSSTKPVCVKPYKRSYVTSKLT